MDSVTNRLPSDRGFEVPEISCIIGTIVYIATANMAIFSLKYIMLTKNNKTVLTISIMGPINCSFESVFLKKERRI